jgi:HK97 family phage major capsid protein
MSPRNVGAYQEVSRQLMLQSDPSVDALVMSDLAKVLALAIDLAAYEGSGSSGQPTGISQTAGIGSVTGTSIAYAGILEFQTDVAASNALAANCAYITTPAVASLLMQRARFSSTDTPLWTGNILDGQVSGFRAMSTLQLTAASMIFGDFSQVVIGEWGMLEIALNPYANFTAAITGIRAIQTVDVGVRIPGAFSRATSIT